MVGGEEGTSPAVTNENDIPPTNSVDANPDGITLLTFLDMDDVLSKVKGHYSKDPFFCMILDSPKTYCNF